MSRLARSFIIINLAEIVFVLSGYFIHAYLGRLLNPADYGRYGLIVTLATMTIVFIGDGIPKALSKYIAQYPKKEKIIKRKAAILQAILVTVVSVLYYLVAPYLARHFFRDESLVSLMRLSTLIIPAFAAASFYNNYFNGLHWFGAQALQRSVRAVARVTAILVLAYYWGIEGAIIGYVAAPVAVSIFSYFYDQNRKKPIVGDFPYRKILRFGLGVVGFMVAYNLVINIDLFLTKRLLGDDYWVGIYNAVITIGRIPFYFFSNLAFILLPTVSKLLEEKTTEDARRLIKDSMRYIIILIVPTVAAIMLYAPEMITLLYSRAYAEGGRALQYFVPGVGALTIFYICTFILNGSGKVRFSAYLTWGGLALNTLLNYVAIPRWGIIGSAAATATTSTVLMIISLYLVTTQFGRFLNFASIARVLGAVILTSAAFYIIPKTIASFMILGVLFFILYFVILSLIGEMNQEDRLRLKELFMKKLAKK